LRRLKDAIRRLPRKHREVFVLREYGGLSYEDLSKTLGLRPGTVMSRLNRARQAVASAMEVMNHE
jgi:RNA polymerase sigma-70 factor (ECF subfamily)